jgi:hypothetical protein
MYIIQMWRGKSTQIHLYRAVDHEDASRGSGGKTSQAQHWANTAQYLQFKLFGGRSPKKHQPMHREALGGHLGAKGFRSPGDLW